MDNDAGLSRMRAEHALDTEIWLAALTEWHTGARRPSWVTRPEIVREYLDRDPCLRRWYDRHLAAGTALEAVRALRAERRDRLAIQSARLASQRGAVDRSPPEPVVERIFIDDERRRITEFDGAPNLWMRQFRAPPLPMKSILDADWPECPEAKHGDVGAAPAPVLAVDDQPRSDDADAPRLRALAAAYMKTEGPTETGFARVIAAKQPDERWTRTQCRQALEAEGFVPKMGRPRKVPRKVSDI
jgi:hypothetical protein